MESAKFQENGKESAWKDLISKNPIVIGNDFLFQSIIPEKKKKSNLRIPPKFIEIFFANSRKLIGARYYVQQRSHSRNGTVSRAFNGSPRDSIGH